MAGIGRPKGSRRISPTRQMALDLFHTWRNQGHPMRVTGNKAYELSCALAGTEGSEEMVSLAATALNAAIAAKGGRGHIAYRTATNRLVCACDDYNCASLD